MTRNVDFPFTLDQLFKAGVHLGHKKSVWNPKMESYLYGVRNGLHIIDLQETRKSFIRALSIIQSTLKANGSCLLIANKRENAFIVEGLIRPTKQIQTLTGKWVGGSLTNWSENLAIRNRTKKTKSKKSALGELTKLPDLLILLNTEENRSAIREANAKSIPVIAIVDTNSDLSGIDYPIPGNDDSAHAHFLYTHILRSILLLG